MKPWQAQYDREVPLSIDYPRITMYELFLEAVKKNPDGVAVWLTMAAGRQVLELDKDAQERLKALGYLGPN